MHGAPGNTITKGSCVQAGKSQKKRVFVPLVFCTFVHMHNRLFKISSAYGFFHTPSPYSVHKEDNY